MLNSNSAGYNIFGFVANFLGQSIPFRQHRSTQKLILQLSIVLTFILGTAYQSIIISLISESRFGTKITTVDGLLNSNYSIYGTKIFLRQINSSDYYRRLEPKLVGLTSVINPKFKDLASRKISIIQSCSSIDHLLKGVDLNIRTENITVYYKLDEKLNVFYLRYPTALGTWFLEKFQDLSSRLFESGLKQAWKLDLPREDLISFKEQQYYENEEYLLNLVDVSPAFYLLAFGLTLSAVTLLMEIFWHDFLRFMNWNKISERMKRVSERRKLRTRIVQVRPINQIESEV